MCMRCQERPRWQGSMWCRECVQAVCCTPSYLAGRNCVHQRFQPGPPPIPTDVLRQYTEDLLQRARDRGCTCKPVIEHKWQYGPRDIFDHPTANVITSAAHQPACPLAGLPGENVLEPPIDPIVLQDGTSRLKR